MLKVIASIYDPLGVLSPIVVRFKFILQDVFSSQVTWDQEVPVDLMTTWKKLLNDAVKLKPIMLERHYLSERNLSEVKNTQLHGFSDASKRAYVAVVYIRNLFNDGTVLTKFVASKTKVAPLKSLTIPKLELMGC